MTATASRAKASLACAALALAALVSVRGEPSLVLNPAGVACRLSGTNRLTLGIPALDARNTHAAPAAGSIVTDGRTLSARFGPPFDGVTPKCACSATTAWNTPTPACPMTSASSCASSISRAN